MFHKKTSAVLFLSLAALLIIGSTRSALAQDAEIPAEEAKPTFIGDDFKEKIGLSISGSLDFYDKYVWRGQYLDTDAVVQPGLAFSAKGFTVGYWGSFPLETRDALNSSESDFYMSYTYTYEMVSMTAGHTWYQFPGGGTSSREVYASIAVATLLSPTLSFYHDYEDGSDLNTDGDGNYWSLSVAHSLPLIEQYGINLDLGMTFGYVDGQWLSGEGQHLTPTIGLKVPVTANMTLTPTIGYNITFGDLEDEAIGNQESKFFGGVKTAMVF